MTSLQNLTAIEARLDVLFTAEPRDNALISELQTRAARLGALLLVEAQRGEMLVCFTTVMLDEFNIDFEINLSHVCHLRLNSFKC
jgi:hypothetical protein